MALGLLNSTIDQISNYIFIDTEIFEKISGRPRIDLSRVMHLDFLDISTHSFIVLKRRVDNKIKLSFTVELEEENSIFNFVFNFRDEDSFKMIRLDNRKHESTPNAFLNNSQKHHWYFVAIADQKQPPAGPFNVVIDINKKINKFDFTVKGQKYKFIKKDGNTIDLYNEFEKGLKIGWFNEEGTVKLSNIKIS